MGWSFRKSFKVGKGARINLSKRGVGTSFGIPGLRFGFGGGRRARVTGGKGPFRFYKSLGGGSSSSKKNTGCGGCLGLILLLFIGGGVVSVLMGPSPSKKNEANTNNLSTTTTNNVVEEIPDDQTVMGRLDAEGATESQADSAAFTISSEVYRIGEYTYQGDLRGYAKSVLVNASEEPIRAVEDVIRVPFKKALEIELSYTPLDLKPEGIFSTPSKFEILSEAGYWTVPLQGKIRSYKVTSDRAILLCHPWVQVPYGDGGKTKARLTLTTNEGKKFTREWTIQVGRNPDVYKELW